MDRSPDPLPCPEPIWWDLEGGVVSMYLQNLDCRASHTGHANMTQAGAQDSTGCH